VAFPAFTEIALILLAAVGLGVLGMAFRQPLLVSFIGVGLLVGPSGIGLITQHEEIELLASFGIAVLLFVVGLKLDIKMLRTLGPVALVTGLAQVVITAGIGLALALALGFALLPAVYIAVALTFSSTIVIVKLLSDTHEIDALHGRIAVGILIVQDVAALLAMIGLAAAGAGREAGTDASAMRMAIGMAVRGIGLLAGVALATRYVLPWLTTRLARSNEMLVLFAIAWAIALAAGADSLGFSKEVGAFLAGLSLASTPYRDSIAGRLVTLRDFLLLFFFIDLGARVQLDSIGAALGPAIVLSIFVLVGKPLIVLGIMGWMGYRKRTSCLTALTMPQVSEFSLILAALGVSVGHLDSSTMGLITFAGIVTIALSTYMMVYSAPIYQRFSSRLSVFERRNPYREMAGDTPDDAPAGDVILIGLGRYGGNIARHLILRGRNVVGIDFDPGALAAWREAGIPVHYGDAEDPELFEHLSLAGAKWVVSTTPDVDANKALLRRLRSLHYKGRVAVACRVPSDEDAVRAEGATVILRPWSAAAEQAADMLTSAMGDLHAMGSVVPGLREMRLGSGSVLTGLTIEQTRLREQFGVNVLAISRAGRSFTQLSPDFQLFPGDHLILSGPPDVLSKTVEHLVQLDAFGPGDALEDFGVDEIDIARLTDWHGRTLADLQLRNRYGVTAVSIRRKGRQELVSPTATDTVQPGDHVVVAGAKRDLQRLQAVASGEEMPVRA